MPRRGDRVAPPARPGQWQLRFADGGAGDGWEKLCANIPTAAAACWDALVADPMAYSDRQKQLRGEFARRTIGGVELPQWQFEVTGKGRVWYCPDLERRVVWLTEVTIGHPSRTDRPKGAG